MIRPATMADRGALNRLLQRAPFSHFHVDWRLPAEWLGTPGFVVHENGRDSKRPQIDACLAAAPDPPPAAWVRLAALVGPDNAVDLLSAMLEQVLPRLRAAGANELGWLAMDAWPDKWLSGLGFTIFQWIETYIKNDVELILVNHNPLVQMRPVALADIEHLAAIETAAFDPLWRHSAQGLILARRQAISFDVAEINGRIVGFQYSTAGGTVAHLTRMTVDPAAQGMGVGSALLTHAINGYRRLGLKSVSLNTQVDNFASHRLYQKFGFAAANDRAPVWWRLL